MTTAPVRDLVAIGRASVDLYGQQIGGRLEDVASFAKYVSGSPTNTAIGGARLGLSTALLTRVGADHMGRFIVEQLGREGVDTSRIRADPDRLTALAILAVRDAETFPLLFYRRDCADAALDVEDVDPAWIAAAAALLVNGTHLAQAGPADAVLKAIAAAKAAGRTVVFDIDYRPVLWGLAPLDRGEDRYVADEAVTRRLQDVLPDCDLVVGTADEFRILGGADDPLDALAAVRAQTGALLVLKQGAAGCTAYPGEIADGLAVPGFPAEVMNVLGAGDAFMAGFLRGWLRGEGLETCCRWGNACGALVVSRHGCAPAMPSWAELRALVAGTGSGAGEIRHLHWCANRRPLGAETLTVLAVDHRAWFEALARSENATPARISAFKALAFRAVDEIAAGRPGFGLLADGRYGAAILAAAADRPYWLGRPIERSHSRPLAFEGSADVATEIVAWPAGQTVKCLLTYHPDDAAALREAQEADLRRLFDACRKTGHELLIELMLPPAMPADPGTTARAIRRLYAAGIRPDWWKLEPSADAARWEAIQAAIDAEDPLCRGVMVMGHSAPHHELHACFRTAAAFPAVRGFAVGRTIFAEPARDWLAGRIGDSGAIRAMANAFGELADAWRSAREAQEDA